MSVNTLWDNDVMRPRLPAALGELLEAELRLIRANLLAQRWDAAHQAIDRLAGEVVLAEPWRIPIAERYALPPQQLGLTTRLANCLFQAGFTTVGALLDAKRGDLFKLENFGPTSLDALREAICQLFRGELQGRSGNPTKDRIWAWLEEMTLDEESDEA